MELHPHERSTDSVAPAGLKTFPGAPWARPLDQAVLHGVAPAIPVVDDASSGTSASASNMSPAIGISVSLTSSSVASRKPLGKPPRPPRSVTSLSSSQSPRSTPRAAFRPVPPRAPQLRPTQKPHGVRRGSSPLSSLAGPVTSPRPSPTPKHRVVFVATDDPTTLDSQWMRERIVKLTKAMRAVSVGSVPHTRLQEQHDRLKRELERRGEPALPSS